MLYAVLLFVHSWLRWLVLAGVIVLAIRAARARAAGAAWTSRDDRWWRTVVGLAGVQLVIGLVLVLWASPIARLAWSSGLRVMLAEPVLWMFGLVHPLAMVAAVGSLHGGWGRIRGMARQSQPDRARHSVALRAAVISLAIVIAASPWPGLPWTASRPLVRAP